MSSKKYLYFPINKCANTSFRALFTGYKHIIIPNLNLNRDKNKNLHLLKDRYNEFFKFTVIRHPISRFLSAVNMFIRDGKLNAKTAVKDAIDIIENKAQSYDRKSKKDYIKRHTLPLTHKLYCLLDDNGELVCDMVVRLEDLKDKKTRYDFFNAIEIRNTVNIPTTNKTNKIIRRESLSNDDINFLNKYYEKDFKTFNYTPYNHAL